MAADAADHARFLPLDGTRYAAASGFDIELAPDIVLVYDQSLVPARSAMQRVIDRLRANRRGSHPFRAVVELADGVDLVLAAGPGSAVAGVTVEMLAALGARRVVSVGSGAGSPSCNSGQAFVISGAAAASGDGPYGPPARPGGPTYDALVGSGLATAEAHTTLWPFRVAASDVDLEQDPPLVIEMEAAVLFAAAATLSLDVNAIVVVSDRYGPSSWQLGDAATTRRELAAQRDAAAEVLASTRIR